MDVSLKNTVKVQRSAALAAANGRERSRAIIVLKDNQGYLVKLPMQSSAAPDARRKYGS